MSRVQGDDGSDRVRRQEAEGGDRKEGCEKGSTHLAHNPAVLEGGEVETDALVVTIVEVIEARKTVLAKRMTTAGVKHTCCAAES